MHAHRCICILISIIVWLHVHTHEHPLHIQYLGVPIEHQTKNTFQHAIVTIMQHTISQLTCVTDNCTTHNECMLHTMFIYCSHILFKPIVILSFVVLPSWNATCVTCQPNSGQEALAVHFFGCVKFAILFMTTKIYLMTRSFPFCATSAMINLPLAGS